MAVSPRLVVPAKSVVENNRRQLKGASSLRYPEDLGSHAMIFNFKNYSYRDSGTITTVSSAASATSDASIILPLPKNLTDSTTPDVMARELGVIGSATADIYGSTGADFKAMGADVASDIMGLLTSGQKESLSDFALFAIKAGIGSISPEIQGGLAAASGTAVNPHSALVFNGVNMKTYTFDWTFIPKNASESEKIKNIINTFKRSSLPSYDSVSGGPRRLEGSNTLSRALLKYPKMVDIFFVGLDQNYFPLIKTAMVSQIVVDYTPQGHLTLVKGQEGSRPQMVNMSVTVIESEIHTADDYAD